MNNGRITKVLLSTTPDGALVLVMQVDAPRRTADYVPSAYDPSLRSTVHLAIPDLSSEMLATFIDIIGDGTLALFRTPADGYPVRTKLSADNLSFEVGHRSEDLWITIPAGGWRNLAAWIRGAGGLTGSEPGA